MPHAALAARKVLCARSIKLLPFPLSRSLFSINPLCAKGKAAKLIRSHEF
jgi:hypothetical protein